MLLRGVDESMKSTRGERKEEINSESLSAYIRVCFILTPANAEEMAM